jgi:hypothetical protein
LQTEKVSEREKDGISLKRENEREEKEKDIY